mmetsp:Transcript_23893/g.65094  ORF Transcript_23893/g.65094 Transcript_23893/m.65094 type:complete len:503 (-) Transcript_23893:40-1548(-)|eukprot:CAMPEP_0171180158 /NCGR_PEP_ID=MMETSP0790-20130122/13616_1 /TAXON_ID=2925 /ORGANISM="Alexandrium catenella, Strain OF101" /LENGTH=502 /DNA_ID=CAMNT_0011645089 /DNA_START=52 /DNA_END=1560 /DNA_ORIENTATION=+
MPEAAVDNTSSSTDQDYDNPEEGQKALQSAIDRTRESRRSLASLNLLVDGNAFQAFMGGVISLNTLAIAGETDHPEWPVWAFLDNVFLIFFLAELALRIGKRGLVPFLASKKEKWWNILDTLIVLLGVVDLWLAPLAVYLVRANEDGHAQMSGGSSMMRFLRLLRLLRLLRVFKLVRKLAAFLEALKAMLGPFFLVIVVMFGFNLFVSIGLTQVLGHGEFEGADGGEEIRPFFCDVQTSFFSLFQIITMDNWFGIVEPVAELNKMWCGFFVVFIVFCSWTMISILTAVASDCVIAATSGSKEKERLEREKKTKEFYRLLRAMFVTGDEDGNGLLDKTEFQQMLETEQLNELLTSLDINVKKEELFEMWDTLDVVGSGTLTIDEFVDGLAYLQEDQIMTRHIANLDYGIRRLSSDLESRFCSLTLRVSEWRAQNQMLLDALQQEERVQQSQALALSVWVQWAVKKDPSCFPPELQDLAFREAERSPVPMPDGPPPRLPATVKD